METPALRQLMGAYFHQDWSFDGSEEDVIDLFLRQNPHLAEGLVDDVEAVLAAGHDEAATEAYVLALGADYDPQTRYGGYRGWLQEVGRRARAHVRGE